MQNKRTRTAQNEKQKLQLTKGISAMGLTNRRKMEKIFITLLAVVLVVSFQATSMAAHVDGISIVDYGLYETTFEQWDPAPKTSDGKIEIVGNMKLLEATYDIPGTAGAEFGLRYVVNGRQDGKTVKILVKIVHVDLDNPQAAVQTDQWVSEKQIGRTTFDGWKFNSDLPKGRRSMTVQLFHGGRKLAEKSFIVHNP